MTSFGLRVEDGAAHKVIADIRSRLLVDNFVKNPFESKIVAIAPDLYVVSIKPIWPFLPMFAPFPAIIWLLFPTHWLGTVGFVTLLLMGFLSLWWCSWFYFALFYLTTRGKVRYVSASRTLGRLV